MNDKLKPLIGRKSIQEHLEIGTTYFYTLSQAGLLVKRVEGVRR